MSRPKLFQFIIYEIIRSYKVLYVLFRRNALERTWLHRDLLSCMN